MRHSVKIIAPLLCMLMVISACGTAAPGSTASTAPPPSSAAAASSAGSAAEPQAENTPVTFSMLLKDEASFPYNESWILWDEITNRTGVTLNAIVVPGSDWNTKSDLLISSGDAPDFIPMIGYKDVRKYLPSNAMVAISDYYDKLPLYTEKLKAFGLEEEAKSLLTELDGKIYSLPAIQEEIWYESYMAYRTDIFDELNLTPPKTFDELYEVLKALKAEYPDVAPWVDKWNGRNMNSLTMGTFGCKSGYNAGESGAGNVYYLRDEDRFVYNALTEDYRTFLRYMNMLAKEGLYDVDVFTISGDQVVEKLTTNKGFISISNTSEQVEWNEFGTQNVGPAFNFQQFVPPAGPKGNAGYAANHMGGGGASGVAIPATSLKNKDFDRMLSFIDWLYYSDEAIDLVWWGVEGTTYKVENGVKQPLEDITYRWMNPGQSMDMRKDFGVGVFAFMGATPKEYRYAMLPPDEQKLQQEATVSRPLQPTVPNVLFTAEQQEEVNLLTSDLRDYAEQMYVKFVAGEADPDTDWDSYVKELEAKRADRLAELYNTAYAATKAAQSK